jgi:hypothetical protein
VRTAAHSARETSATLAPMPSVPVRYRRAERGLFLQKIQHAIPSVVVLGDGVGHLQHDPHGASLALGLAEVSVSALVIGSVLRGVHRVGRSPARTARHR